MSLPTLVIVGRPNVGKSSLFNRILGRREAVVADREGVTRDRHYQRAEWNGRPFQVVDTGGFTPKELDVMDNQIKKQIELAIDDSDHVLFMIDGKVGITDLDLQFSRIIQRKGKPVTLLVNKAENRSVAAEALNCWSLGLGEPHPISALQGTGLADALDQVFASIPFEKAPPKEDPAIRVAVLGRPNAGKSTLINALIGEDRFVTSEVAGTTRDAIDTHFHWEGKHFILTDTAGLRRKARVEDQVEYFSNLRTIEAIRRSQVCILLIDAQRGMEIQDFRICDLVQEAGKGLIIALNKWDMIDAGDKTFDHTVRDLMAKAPQLDWIPFLATSGLTGRRISKLLEKAVKVKESLEKVLGREKVIEYFQQAVAVHPHPPTSRGPANMKRCCQVLVNPPALAFEIQHPERVFESYKRYLRKSATEYFELEGVPLRIWFRKRFQLRTDEDLVSFLRRGPNPMTEENWSELEPEVEGETESNEELNEDESLHQPLNGADGNSESN